MTRFLVAVLLVLLTTPAWAAPGEWTRASANTLADVLWRDATGKTVTALKGGGSIEGQFAWSGGAMDTDRCVLVMDGNGGHGDGADNGAYAFTLGTGLFSLLRAPTVDLIPTLQQPTQAWYVDAAGKLHKASRHNYAAQVYMPSVKRVWQGSGVVWWSSGSAGPQSWETDVLTGVSVPTDPFGIGAGFDGWNSHPEIQAVWAGTRVLYVDYGRLRAYDPAKPAGTRVSGVDAGEGDGLSDSRYRGMSPLYDARRDRVVLIGSHSEGTTVVIWERTGDGRYKRRPITMAAPWGALYAFGVAPLVVLDPVADRYLVFPGGRTVRAIDPVTFAVTDLTPSSGETPDPASSTGTYNRGGYCPATDTVVVVHKVAGSAWAWKPVRSGGGIPPVVVPPIVIPPAPPTLTPRVFLALPTPPVGQGVSADMKHTSSAFNPDDGAIYMTGGDYAGGSYRQETWRLDLAARLASTDPAAGWSLVYPYCGPAGAVQPKSPDHMGWAWDTARKLFWMVPGVSEVPALPVLCPGITQTKNDDPGFLYGHLWQFRPTAELAARWTSLGRNVGPPSGEGTWFSSYDATTDRLYRIGWDGAHGGVVDILDAKTLTWSTRALGLNAAGQDVRLTKEYIAHDQARRHLYGIDAVRGRLHRYDLGTFALADLGPVPGGPDPYQRENLTHLVWDSRNSVLLWRRHSSTGFYAYTPATTTWETIPIVTDPPGLPVNIRAAVYDPKNNVSLWFGGKIPDEGATPHLHVFRYAVGTEPPTVVTPPIVIPPPVVTPPAKPRVKITAPPGVEIEVNGQLVP